MSFLSRLKSKIEEHREELHELGPRSRTSIADGKASRPQTGIPSGKRNKQTTINTIDLENKILELEAEFEKEKTRGNELRNTIQSRQERYVKREQEYRSTVTEYENKLNEGFPAKDPRLYDTTTKNLEKINQYHSEILQKIGTVQHKTMNLLKNQEIEIVKGFNSDLTEKSRELEEEKKKDSDKGEMNQKESKLHEELESNKSQIDLIDSKNKYLTQRNSELKIEFKSHDQDKKILEAQIQALRATNEKVKRSLEIYRSNYTEPQTSMPPVRGKSARIQSAVSRVSDKEVPNQYQSVISKLKRMIELDQKNTRAARTAYARELEAKKELELMLRQCVDDVKVHINKKRSEQRMNSSEKSVEDIEKVIEILLSQERVLTLLYDKTFPPRSLMKEPFFNGTDSRTIINQEDVYEVLDNIDSSIEIDDN